MGTMRAVVGGVGVAAITGLACAQVVPLVETEGNDTFASANFIHFSNYPTGAVAIDGQLTAGDVDFFSFQVSAGDFVTFSVFGLTFDGDGYLGIFAPDGALFGADDDSGVGLFPSYAFVAPTSGVWAFAVTGYGDEDFLGAHGESFLYKAVFATNPAPTPGAAGLLGLGALAATRRRR